MADLTPGGRGLGAQISAPIPRSSGFYQEVQGIAGVQQNNDLRAYKGGSLAIPVRNQQRTSACTAFAGTAVRAALTAKYHLDRGEDPDIGDTPSPRYAYYYIRQIDGDATVDQGASMQAACQVYVDHGVSPARFDPWDDSRAAKDDLAWLNAPPSADAEAGAQFFGASGYARLNGTGMSLIGSILQCLADGYPPLIAIQVPPSFESVGRDGRVPLPKTSEQVLGGHALAVFASFADQSAPGGGWLVFQNSWDAVYGESGWGYLPWAWATNSPRGSNTAWLSESWTIR